MTGDSDQTSGKKDSWEIPSISEASLYLLSSMLAVYLTAAALRDRVPIPPDGQRYTVSELLGEEGSGSYGAYSTLEGEVIQVKSIYNGGRPDVLEIKLSDGESTVIARSTGIPEDVWDVRFGRGVIDGSVDALENALKSGPGRVMLAGMLREDVIVGDRKYHFHAATHDGLRYSLVD